MEKQFCYYNHSIGQCNSALLLRYAGKTIQVFNMRERIIHNAHTFAASGSEYIDQFDKQWTKYIAKSKFESKNRQSSHLNAYNPFFKTRFSVNGIGDSPGRLFVFRDCDFCVYIRIYVYTKYKHILYFIIIAIFSRCCRCFIRFFDGRWKFAGNYSASQRYAAFAFFIFYNFRRRFVFFEKYCLIKNAIRPRSRNKYLYTLFRQRARDKVMFYRRRTRIFAVVHTHYSQVLRVWISPSGIPFKHGDPYFSLFGEPLSPSFFACSLCTLFNDFFSFGIFLRFFRANVWNVCESLSESGLRVCSSSVSG